MSGKKEHQYTKTRQELRKLSEAVDNAVLQSNGSLFSTGGAKKKTAKDPATKPTKTAKKKTKSTSPPKKRTTKSPKKKALTKKQLEMADSLIAFGVHLKEQAGGQKGKFKLLD